MLEHASIQNIGIPTPPPSEADVQDAESGLGDLIKRGAVVSQLPALDYASLLTGPLVHIKVGIEQEQKQWSIHRNLLIHHSPYFLELFTKDEKTTPNVFQHVELAEDSPSAFGIFVKWLYQGTIDDVTSLDMDKKWDYAFACQHLYVLCDRLRIPQLKNAAIDQFRRGCYEAGLVPGAEETMLVYKTTPPGSPFRKLVSRIAVRQIMDPDNRHDASDYRQCFESNPDFAVDVVNAIKAGMGGKLLEDPTELVGCEYHDHTEDSACGLNTKHNSSGSGILKKTVKWRESV